MRKFVLAIVLVLMATGAQAVTMNVVGGQLVGASDVQVGYLFFDVEFVDGTCFDLFTGCNDASDFTFGTQQHASWASQALLDQVFLDGPSGLFDSFSSLTFGCSDLVVCAVVTPYEIRITPPAGTVEWVAAVNYPSGSDDDFLFTSAELGGSYSAVTVVTNFLANPDAVWARWSPAAPIPEPSTGLLVSTGLLGLAARCRSLRS